METEANDKVIFVGHSIMKGVAEGIALVTKQSFGFLGSLDPETGLVIDKKHELYGQKITNKILVFPNAIGSTMGAIYFLDAVRCKNSPAAMINLETEPILAAGVVMAEIFYEKNIPVVDRISSDFFDKVHSGDFLKVNGTMGLVERVSQRDR